jgi:hypothetical protein
MRKSITEACARENAGEAISKELVQNMMGIDNFRLPDTNVQQFLDYGVGSHGLYISFDKDTDKPLSVWLLSRPSMNKNVFFFLAVVDAIKRFAEEVSDDFCSQDDGSLCAMARFTVNFETILLALFSPDLLAMWPIRKTHPGGVVGISHHGLVGGMVWGSEL